MDRLAILWNDSLRIARMDRFGMDWFDGGSADGLMPYFIVSLISLAAFFR